MRGTRDWTRLAYLILPVLLPAANGQALSIDLDQQKTQVAFVLTDVLHTVHGNFQLKQGHISIAPATNTMSGDIVVDATSGDSGSAARDKRMTRDILQAQRFPEIRFSPTAYKGSIALDGNSEAEVSGSFTIHGDAHNITIPMHVQIIDKKAIATGKFTVPYVQWGMRSASNFLLKVSDTVEIYLTAVGHIRLSSP
jgi:polyisoprenoid-binding protein YceI